MFKELIEKLQAEITSEWCAGHFDNARNQGIDKAIDIVKEYQKEQEKAFDPELVGFKLTFHSEEDNISEYELVKGRIIYSIRYFRNENKIWVLLKYPGDDKSRILSNLIKVPSHNFGVDLLKNLGVI